MEIRNMLTHIIPDVAYIQLVYFNHFRRFANLKHPKTFNEKIQWLKLHDRNPQYTIMVDKYKVKEYVAGIIGEKHIIPTLGVWEKPNEIEFDKLPQQFVLKWNHDSGSIIICKDRSSFDEKAAIKKLSGRERYNGYNYGREWPYKNVKPVIIAEQYMEDSETAELRDYKVHNFNGKPKFILVCGKRFSYAGLSEDFYSDKWEHMDVRRPKHPNAEVPVEQPEELQQILEFSRILSKGIPFLRTDFYIVNHKIYFGELTFFPASGFERFEPEEWDNTFGSWLTLPSEKTYSELVDTPI